MASDTLSLRGQLKITPAPQALDNSANPLIAADILEQQIINIKSEQVFALNTDPAVTVPFGGLTSATAVMIKSNGGKLKASFTSADGFAQSIPVDGFLFITSASVPFTSLTIQRVPGIAVTARIILASP